VTFSEHQLPKSLKDSINRRSLEREYDELHERKQYRESFGGLPVDQERALWYTQPVHLSRQEYSLSAVLGLGILSSSDNFLSKSDSS
jgi:hypothetical protein